MDCSLCNANAPELSSSTPQITATRPHAHLLLLRWVQPGFDSLAAFNNHFEADLTKAISPVCHPKLQGGLEAVGCAAQPRCFPAALQTPPRPQGSSFESPAASPGAPARMITSESPLPTSGATFWFRFSASVHWFSLLWQIPEPSATAVPAV